MNSFKKTVSALGIWNNEEKWFSDSDYFRRNSGTDAGSLILELLKLQNQWIIIISNNYTTLIININSLSALWGLELMGRGTGQGG
jgi:hypothetical protein